jgi:hypothetical protein
MQQARGGILLIDEAHGLYSDTGNWYAREAVEALIGHITEKEFKGNLLVIMSGYADELNTMFSRANPGLRSRFDKIRVVFPAWTGRQAAVAVAAAVEAEGRKLTEEAELELYKSFDCAAQLPSWSSARDVFEKIIPAMYMNRAARLASNILHSNSAPVTTASANSGQLQCATQQLPYDTNDVIKAFRLLLGDNSAMLVLNSGAELHAAIQSAIAVKRLMVVLVCWDTCKYNSELSAGMENEFEDLSHQFSESNNVLFAKLKVEKGSDCIHLNEVQLILPETTFVCFYDGVEVQRLTEIHVFTLRDFIISFLAKAARPNSFMVCRNSCSNTDHSHNILLNTFIVLVVLYTYVLVTYFASKPTLTPNIGNSILSGNLFLYFLVYRNKFHTILIIIF